MSGNIKISARQVQISIQTAIMILGQFGLTINENAIKDKISGLNPNDYVVADGSIINEF